MRAIGRCAIKVESAAERCVGTLVDLIQTKVTYVVQEAVIVIKVCAILSCFHSLWGLYMYSYMPNKASSPSHIIYVSRNMYPLMMVMLSHYEKEARA